jgi:hypothetical protein
MKMKRKLKIMVTIIAMTSISLSAVLYKTNVYAKANTDKVAMAVECRRPKKHKDN